MVANVLLMVKGNQKTLHRQIQCQFQGERHIPFTATAQGIKHCRDTIREMGALDEGFRNAVGSPGSHQRELAWRLLDHREEQHHRDRQRPSSATGPTTTPRACGPSQKPCYD